jgi:hypothetical protein
MYSTDEFFRDTPRSCFGYYDSKKLKLSERQISDSEFTTEEKPGKVKEDIELDIPFNSDVNLIEFYF